MDGVSSRQAKRRIPRFFKFFDATKYSDQLHIPTAFASCMEGNLPRRAFLRDAYGNKWPVQLMKIESEWYFGEGWAKAAGDNGMEHCDFILFQFDGNKLFHFQIIGRDSCSKAGVGSLKFKLEDHEDEEEEEDEDEFLHQFRDGREEEVDDDDDGGKKKAKASMDIYGAKMIQSGLFVQPKNPYFVTKIRPNRPQELYVPVDVVRDFELTLPERMVLRDPAGRDWPAYLRTWKDGRTFYTGGGWKKLCMVNLIGDVRDRCVCEFVQEAGKLLLQIQIVRFRHQN